MCSSKQSLLTKRIENLLDLVIEQFLSRVLLPCSENTIFDGKWQLFLVAISAFLITPPHNISINTMKQQRRMDMFCEEESGDIMTVEGLMDYLNIGRTTTYKLLKSGKIKVLRIGRIYRISKASVEEYVRKESK